MKIRLISLAILIFCGIIIVPEVKLSLLIFVFLLLSICIAIIIDVLYYKKHKFNAKYHKTIYYTIMAMAALGVVYKVVTQIKNL